MSHTSMTRRRFLRMMGGGAMALTAGACSLRRLDRPAESARPFTIAVLPDTQHYSREFPEIFMSQTRWIAHQAAALNIQCVIHEGDITDNNTNQEWEHAVAAIEALDGKVPCCLNVGNHDLPGWGRERDVSQFNRYFPAAKYDREPWFGGVKPGGGLENAWYQFQYGGVEWLVLCLEFGPTDEGVEWANGILAAHPRHRAIVATHCYMYFDDTRVGPGDQWNPHSYGVGGNDGEELWEKLVSRHDNIVLVLSGHILGDGLGRMVSPNAAGWPVHQILANYQMLEKGGNGWLRLMTIDPAQNTVSVRTYSPYLDQYAEDSQNQFSLSLV